MLRLKILLGTFALLASSLACVTLLGTDVPESGIPAAVTQPPAVEIAPTVETPITCPVLTDQIMKVATSGGDNLGENLLDQEVYLVSYTVSGDEISNPTYEDVPSNLQDDQADTSTHQRIWDYFAALIPADERALVAEYSIFTDGQGGTLAAVAQTQTDPSLWALEVDVADISDTYDLTYTLVHEFGHLLTLGPAQVSPSLAVFNNPDDNNIYLKEVSSCPQYFPGEGCANSDSYINAFYDQFWTELHEEWNAINLEEDEDTYNDRLDAFYNKYQDQFVTDYAPTNPEEDMAESWAFFVLSPRPSGATIADEKVLFFYQYPELVDLRGRILNNVCVSFPK